MRKVRKVHYALRRPSSPLSLSLPTETNFINVANKQYFVASHLPRGNIVTECPSGNCACRSTHVTSGNSLLYIAHSLDSSRLTMAVHTWQALAQSISPIPYYVALSVRSLAPSMRTYRHAIPPHLEGTMGGLAPAFAGHARFVGCTLRAIVEVAAPRRTHHSSAMRP